jgi:DNA-binding response OmpR family regulator
MQTILLIEDDEPTLKRLTLILEKFGYRVLQDCDGDNALRLLETGQPDLILTDLNLPAQSGLDILSSVRGSNNAIPVIAMSGGDSLGQDFLEISKIMGADAVLKKPFTPEQLLAQIEHCLNRQD